MNTFYEIVVVIPIGPDSNPAYIIDTVKSFTHYCSSSYKIILSDDSQKNISSDIAKQFPDIDVLHTRKQMGSMCGLYISLANAFSYALQKYDFKLLFKVDTDALIIGNAPEKEALRFFKENPSIGIAGQYPLDYNSMPWDTKFPKDRIINGTTSWKFIKRPIGNYFLRKIYIKAKKNGYNAGESVFGGAYFMSRALLEKLNEEKLLPNYYFSNLNLGEDHLFSLLAKATGFELGNLASNNMPFGCAWKGLPASPEQLKNDGKKIIHSVRQWKEMGEHEIRSYFKQDRDIKQPSLIKEGA